MSHPPILLLGVPRSGTTWIGRISAAPTDPLVRLCERVSELRDR